GRWKTPLRASPTFGKLLFIRGCQGANHHRTVAEPSLSHRSDVRWRTRTYSAVLSGRAAGSHHPDRATGAGATGSAVTARVLVQVLLVVVLGEVEGPQRGDLRGDPPVPGPLEHRLEGVPGRLGGLPLLLGVVEDRGPVLGTDVIALA